MPRLPKILADAASPFLKSRDPLKLQQADLNALHAKRARLSERLAGIVAAYDAAGAEQRAALIEESSDAKAIDARYADLRGLAEQRTMVEQALADLGLQIDDGERRRVAMLDKIHRETTAAEAEARAAKIEAAAARLADAAATFGRARADLEAAAADNAVADGDKHPRWLVHDVVIAAVRVAAPGAIRGALNVPGVPRNTPDAGPPPDVAEAARERLVAPLRAHAAAVLAGHVQAVPLAIPPSPTAHIAIHMDELAIVLREPASYVGVDSHPVLLREGQGSVFRPVAEAAIRAGMAVLAGTPDAVRILKEQASARVERA